MRRDWRLPENRREAFQRFYSFHLKYRTHPGCVYFMLPALAEAYDLDDDGRAWLVWLNGNTQNPVTSQLLLEASNGRPEEWGKAVALWDDHWGDLQWDTDRRYQKGRFGEATAAWIDGAGEAPASNWRFAARKGWDGVWRFANSQPFMGRLSAWSMTEYARILLGPGIPDASTLLLRDRSGSRSHRNGLAVIAGFDAAYWGWEEADLIAGVPFLEDLAEDLLREARERNPGNPDVIRLTLESALCTYKSWHKPNRRYPNVYADMHHDRIRWAESRWGAAFKVQWDARARALPERLRLEDNPDDPGVSPEKQNQYLTTGVPPMMEEFGMTLEDEGR